MIVTLDSKRRLTVPAAVPAKPGDHFLVDFDAEEDALMCRRIASKPNWLKVLKACPVPMDDLPPRRREYFRSKLWAGSCVGRWVSGSLDSAAMDRLAVAVLADFPHRPLTAPQPTKGTSDADGSRRARSTGASNREAAGRTWRLSQTRVRE
jgi:hypothetical protein